MLSRTEKRPPPIFVALALAAALPASRARAAEEAQVPRFPEVRRAVLENGMTVILQEDHAAPRVAFALRYRAGLGQAPWSRPELPELAAKVLTGAASTDPAHTFVGRLRKAGATDTRTALGRDHTELAARGPADHLEALLSALREQLDGTQASLDEPTVSAAIAAVEAERAKRRSQPLGSLEELVEAAAIDRPHAPPGPPSTGIGLVRELGRFLEVRYGAEDAILVLVGDFRPDDALALVKSTFGSLPRGTIGKPWAPARALTSEVRLKIAAKVDHPALEVAWPTPLPFARGDAELDVIRKLLELDYQAELVEKRRLASKVEVVRVPSAVDPLFTIRVTAAASQTPEELLRAVDEVFDVRLTHVVPSDLIAKVLAESLVAELEAGEEVTNRALELARYAQYTDAADAYGLDYGRYFAVDTTKLEWAAFYLLPRRARVVALVTPSAKAPVGGDLVEVQSKDGEGRR